MGMIEVLLVSVFMVLGIALPHFKARKTILAANVGTLSINALLMFVHGQPLASLVYLVALCGSLSQILLPNSGEAHIKKLRIGIAMALVMVGGFLLYKTVMDLILIAGFAVARFGETAQTARCVRLSFLASCFLFLCFAVFSGVTSVILTQSVLFLSLVIGVVRYENVFGLSSAFSAYFRFNRKSADITGAAE